MSPGTGVGCQCTKCGTQWYENGACQSCGSAQDIQFTWVVANPAKGAVPSVAPVDTFQLLPGACAQLIDSWTNLVLVRGLTPILTSPGPAPAQLISPGWYRQRGVKCSVQFAEPPRDPKFGEKFNQASDWTNKSFVVRLVVTFEAFATSKKPKESRLPKALGMREFHHARNLRNAIAHGNPLTKSVLVSEEAHLFRQGTAGASSCRLAIDDVLEPLWARLLIYAASLETGTAPLSLDPAVVVVNNGTTLTVQSFAGLRTIDLNASDSRSKCRVGEIIAL